MKEPQYILHIIVTNISYTPSHSSCLVEHVLHKRYTSHTSSIKIYIGPWSPLVFQKMRVKELSARSYDMV